MFKGGDRSSFQVPENPENSARKVYVVGGSVAKKSISCCVRFFLRRLHPGSIPKAEAVKHQRNEQQQQQKTKEQKA